MEYTPIEFLKITLDPISKKIDANGGPHVLIGLIASGGQPQLYVVGNTQGNLKAEIYEALADLLRTRATEERTGKKAIIGANDFHS